jgi:hypothetical protein
VSAVGKQARKDRQRRERDRTRHADAARVGDAALAAAELVTEAAENELFPSLHQPDGTHRTIELRWSDVAGMRRAFLREGWSWPSWCWLPGQALTTGVATALTNEIGVRPTSKSLQSVLPYLPVANWYPGRTAVRYHPELAAALIDTPLDGTIPVDALYRMPAWGLYLDTPHLGDGAGVFASVSPTRFTVPGRPASAGADQLFLVFVDPPAENPVVLFAFGLDRTLDHIVDVDADDLYGRPFREVVTSVLSLLVYLCVDEPDLATIDVPAAAHTPAQTRRHVPVADHHVIAAGWRLGADLAAARRHHAGPDGTAGGAAVTPHLRRAHWHHYWTGPRSDPERRRLELRFLAPTLVGTANEHLDVATVRTAVEENGPRRHNIADDVAI